jgi:crotonobetainyl-CoA:carnitine CoA-transferase CaiB-like acyl-CoA transferase
MPPFFHDEAHLEKSLLFLYLNTNKRSVTLNLKSRRGKEMFLELLRDADLLVENYSPRIMPSLGLTYEALCQINPALVMVSISNFGQTGPYRDYHATDLVEYALGGLMYIFGAYDREPLKHALRQAQFKAGTNAATASLIALFNQQINGQGQHVDVSIQESVASGLRDVVSNYTYTGAVRRRQPKHTGDLSRVRATSDGYILPNPGLATSIDMSAVADFLAAPELNNESFRSPSGRLANAEELGKILDKRFATLEKFKTFYAAQEKRFMYGVVQSPAEVIDDANYAARGYFVDVNHSFTGTLKYPGAPFRMSKTPWRILRPAPTLGQHIQEIFGGHLGYSDQDLVLMRAMEVI